MNPRRPYIPLAVRVKVAERQLVYSGRSSSRFVKYFPLGRRLKSLLQDLFGDEKAHLDHYPALVLRDYDIILKRYNPDANDPDYLIYRTVHSHHIKTNVHGEGAQRSDTAERMHRRRMAENRGERKRKPKAKIAQRKNPWPKGRRFGG